MVIGLSNNMCLTDRIFLQTHVAFCEYLVFHEFRHNLYITLAKHLEQEDFYNKTTFKQETVIRNKDWDTLPLIHRLPVLDRS